MIVQIQSLDDDDCERCYYALLGCTYVIFCLFLLGLLGYAIYCEQVK